MGGGGGGACCLGGEGLVGGFEESFALGYTVFWALERCLFCSGFM